MNQALFTSMSGPDPGVFDSQVLDYGRFMRSLEVEFRYLLIDGFQAWKKSRGQTARTLEGIRREHGVRIEIEYVLRPLSPLGLRQAEAKVVAHARKMARSEGPVLIQARGVQAAVIAVRAKRAVPSAAVVYDARGDVCAEALMEARHCGSARERKWWEQRARRLEILEKEAVKGADHVLAVSGPLKQQLVAAAGISASAVSVIPCCVDPGRFTFDPGARERVRSRLGLGDARIVVYAGSLSAWQIPDRVAELVGSLCEARPEIHFLVLTRDPDAAGRHFGRLIGSRRCTLIDCPYGEVGGYLQAADLGLLLREPDPVNRVASPVKFAEYQACGLPVVVTPGIGDVSEYVRTTGFGTVLDPAGSPQGQIAEIVDSLMSRRWDAVRSDIRERAIAAFSRESYRSTYQGMLHRLGLSRERGALAPLTAES